jgi:hypoxanthine phosphoribosyltransferase
MRLSREILKSETEIADRVRALGREITQHYKGQEVAVLGVLKGAFVFLADLVRHLDLDVQIGFLESITARKTSFLTEIVFSSSFRIEGNHLLVVEDILDTGVTLAYLSQQLELYRPRSLRIVTLLDKPQRRKVDLQPEHVGFQVPDRHVVGYGLDYEGRYRNLPYLTYVE